MADGVLFLICFLLLLLAEFSAADIKKVVDHDDLSKAYNNSVLLDDKQVSFFWTLSPAGSISIAARSKKRSGRYLAIAFGDGMIDSYAYIAWVDGEGKGRVSTYWIDGKSPSSIHPTFEILTGVRCRSVDGFISFEFNRPLSPSCERRETDPGQCQKNVIDPARALKVVWARGARWPDDDEQLSLSNMHARTSERPANILLAEGYAEPTKDAPAALVAHGLLMFFSWGILFPGGVLAARYLKQTFETWLRVHVFLQCLGFAIAMAGVLVAAVELKGIFISSWHAGFGLIGTAMAFGQMLIANIRPGKNNPKMETANSRRRRSVWTFVHRSTGGIAILVGIVAILSGLKYLADVYDDERVDVLTLLFMVWILSWAFMILYLEYRELKRIRWDRNYFGDNQEDDGMVNLLGETRQSPDQHLGVEVQLQSLSSR